MRGLSRAFVVAIAAAAACYGAGGPPQGASDATVVFALPQEPPCGVSQYIGSIAFDPAGVAYAVILPSVVVPGCDHAVLTPVVDVVLERLGPDPGSPASDVATITRSDGADSRPRVAIGPGGQPVWAYRSPSTILELLATGSGASVGSSTGPAIDVAGVAADADHLFTAGWTDAVPYQSGVDDPNYPVPGGNDGVIGLSAFTLTAFPLAGGSAEPMFADGQVPHFNCGIASDCVAANADSLFYQAFTASSGSAYLGRLPKTVRGGSAADEGIISTPDTLPLQIGVDPAGLAVDETRVVWSVSSIYEELYGGVPGICKIWSYDFATKQITQLLSTGDFACRGLELDGPDVYFTVVSLHESDQDRAYAYLHGDGVGRISSSGDKRLLTLDISGIAAGPRRVFVRGESIYLIDPFAVVRISKAALDAAPSLP